MFNLGQLDESVADLGLLIGLLTSEADGDGSVNVAWFSDPATEIKKGPTRVAGLLRFLDSLFPLTGDTEYALLDRDEAWHSIYSAGDDRPTGLCLIIPKAGSTSGDISLGLFHQLSVDDLTISLRARLPLFYLNEGQVPQFIPVSDLSDRKKFEIAIDVYSASAIQVGADTFNLMSAAATVNFDNSFQTSFDLSFYKGFDPVTGSKTKLPTPAVNDVVNALRDLVTQASYWLGVYIGDSSVTIGDLLAPTGLVKQTTDSAGTTTYSFDRATFDQLKSQGPTAVIKTLLTKLVTDLFDELVNANEPLVAIDGGGIYVAKDASTNSYGLRLVIPDYQVTSSDSTGPKVVAQLGKNLGKDTDGWIKRGGGDEVDPGIEILFLKYDGTTLSTTSQLELNSIGVDVEGSGNKPLFNINGYVLNGAELRIYLKQVGATWTFGAAASLDDFGKPLGDGMTGNASNPVAQSLLSSGSNGSSGAGADNAPVNPTFSAAVAWISQGTGLDFQLYADDGSTTDKIWFPVQRGFGPLHCQRLGIEWPTPNPDERLSFLFDGDVATGGLEVWDVPTRRCESIRAIHYPSWELPLSFQARRSALHAPPTARSFMWLRATENYWRLMPTRLPQSPIRRRCQQTRRRSLWLPTVNTST